MLTIKNTQASRSLDEQHGTNTFDVKVESDCDVEWYLRFYSDGTFDVFGREYRGIPLKATASISLGGRVHDSDLENRKDRFAKQYLPFSG